MTLGCCLAKSGPAQSKVEQIKMRKRAFILLKSEEFAKLPQVSRDGLVGILCGFVLEHDVAPIVGFLEDVDEAGEIGGNLLAGGVA